MGIIELNIVKCIALLISIAISEIISDFILIQNETKNGRKQYKIRFNFEALNPFISHDRAMFMYFIQLILIVLISTVIESIFQELLINNFIYWLPILFLTITALYMVIIKKLKIKMTPKRWITFTFLVIITFGLFAIIHNNQDIQIKVRK